MDPYRTSGDNAFDFRRHFGEFLRVVLPIFVIISAAGLLIFLVWGPEPEKAPIVVEGPPARVGLLPVEVAGVESPAGLPFDPAFVIPRPIDLAKAPQSARFDAPMGSELGALTYNAQPFLTTRHLGDDLNGIGGWDSDLGDPVYSVADGEVLYAGWPSNGWGNVITILHQLPDGRRLTTFYGHLEKMLVPVGAIVRRGDRIGTVGKADGRYLAHLHFEIRSAATLNPGAGYADTALGRLAGEPFLGKFRGAPEDQQNPALGGEFSQFGQAARSRSPSLKVQTDE